MEKINLNQKIPNHLAFVIIITLSFLTAWFSVTVGNKIIEKAKQSPVFNLEKRIQQEIPDKDVNNKASQKNKR